MTINEKQRLTANGFARSNGRVLCVINILRIKYNKLAGVKNVLKGEGVTEDEFLDAVNFLAEEGYIRLRRTSTREEADLADCDYTALEAKLTGKGIRLRAGDIKDDMVEVASSDKSALRAGNFIQGNARVLCTLNVLAHKFRGLDGVQSLLEDDGITRDEFLDCVNFLTEEGYIHLRRTATREDADLADCCYTELEVKLNAKGIRLLMGGIADGLIEV